MGHWAVAVGTAWADWARALQVPAGVRETAGYLAALLVFATFSMKSMRGLRLVAIGSNIAFITYAAIAVLPPILVLHGILLPLNLARLAQMHRAAAAARRKLSEPDDSSGPADLARPHFLTDTALPDPDAALALAAREQDRAIALLAACIPGDAAVAGGLDPARVAPATGRLLADIDRFLAALGARKPTPAQLARMAELHSRNETLAALLETLQDLAPLLGGNPAGRQGEVAQAIATGLGALLLHAEQAARSGDAADAALLLRTTGDRGALVDRLRASVMSAGSDGALAAFRAVYATTALYERAVWLLHRYAMALSREARGAPGGG